MRLPVDQRTPGHDNRNPHQAAFSRRAKNRARLAPGSGLASRRARALAAVRPVLSRAARVHPPRRRLVRTRAAAGRAMSRTVHARTGAVALVQRVALPGPVVVPGSAVIAPAPIPVPVAISMVETERSENARRPVIVVIAGPVTVVVGSAVAVVIGRVVAVGVVRSVRRRHCAAGDQRRCPRGEKPNQRCPHGRHLQHRLTPACAGARNKTGRSPGPSTSSSA